MTIPEIAAQLRMVLGVCAKADANVSPAERIYFAAAQNDCSDEEIISFWLTVSSLEEHQVPMFVAKHWAKRASNILAAFVLVANPAFSIELFPYRGAAKDGGTLEYVFEGGEQNSPNAVTKEKAAEIAADL